MDRLTCDRMFAAVMDTGSFSAAAARIGTSSGQASKLVSRLEGELGVRLLNRTTRALSPTEAGQVYYERLRLLLEEFDTLDAAVRSSADTPRGRIRLTVPLTFGTMRLVPVLNAFVGRYPDITLDVQFTDRLVSLVDEGFDAAIRVGRPVDSSLIARKLCDSHLHIVGSPAYLDRRGAPARPEDLTLHDCIIDTNMRDPHRWPFAGGQMVPVAGRLAYGNAEACLLAAEAGLGIARLPDFVAESGLAAGRILPVLTGYDDPGFGVFALYPPGRHLAGKIRALVDFLGRNLRSVDRWPGREG